MSAVAPGGAIGILGGGQLGRMLAIAAAQLGLDAHIYTDEPDSPAARVSAKTVVADYHDHAALAAFAHGVDAVTTEFENVPADTAQALIDAGAIVRPNARALAIAQDRLLEKDFFNAQGIATAPYAAVDAEGDLAKALETAGAPAILKTRTLGYDGKGQARIASAADARAAYAALGRAPCILEGMCGFAMEFSIVAARGEDGAFAAYAPTANTHRDGILWRSIAPAPIAQALCAQATDATRALMAALDYVGVLAIEFFLMPDGALLANEMAPRVHNSGHWTIEGARTSQFEQHIRAVSGWPLGPPESLGAAEMLNLIGDDVSQWRDHVGSPGAHVHFYGKREARAGRKMGHVTWVGG
ncbi:MAG: 5-(carboxyamino)imidazole ribonucleotide synthase [Alphaproteobacteria bacterium]|nr:5-(carboxyamino)imidazole ribonucleotide synthase [Alphaproteobacteria bacterium]